MILVDVTTSYMFRHLNPVGILRVEQEVIRTFREDVALRDGAEEVVFGIYQPLSDAYYRLSQTDLGMLIRDGAWRRTIRPRALAERRLWPSRRRKLQYLRALWRTLAAERRARPPTGQAPAERRTDAAGHYRTQQRLAEDMAGLSIDEYAAIRRWLVRASALRPGIAAHLTRLDEINGQLEAGNFEWGAAARFDESARIDPASVRHYVAAGAFWSDSRHRYAHDARAAHGWCVHYLVYDMIPILWRHVTEPTTKETFPAALHWVLWGVDQIWTISQTTKNDLLAYIDDHGYPTLPDDRVTPVYLGADIDTGTTTETAGAGIEPGAEPGVETGAGIAIGADAGTDTAAHIAAHIAADTETVLARYRLEPGRFVLMVGTLEPRKNHDFAYRLWRELHRRHPGETIPLVWVGQPGWSIGPLMGQVGEDIGLPHQAIHILSVVSDAELAVLYRACRFTLFPAHYEGWGLPLVESLNYGRPCLASDAPALIEAGRGAAEHIGLFDGERWLARIHALVTDEAAYAEALAHAATFRRWRWRDFRADLATSFLRLLAPGDAPAGTPAGTPGTKPGTEPATEPGGKSVDDPRPPAARSDAKPAARPATLSRAAS